MSSKGLLNCETGKALMNCETGKGLLHCVVSGTVGPLLSNTFSVTVAAGATVKCVATGIIYFMSNNRSPLTPDGTGEVADATWVNFRNPPENPEGLGMIKGGLYAVDSAGNKYQFGTNVTQTITAAGSLTFKVNDNNYADNSGNWSLAVTGGN